MWDFRFRYFVIFLIIVYFLYLSITCFFLTFLYTNKQIRGDFVQRLRHFWAYILIGIFILSYFPNSVFASTIDENGKNDTASTYVLFSDEVNEQVSLYKEATEQSEKLIEIPDDQEVLVLSFGETLSQILYRDTAIKKEYIGYVYTRHLVTIDEAEQFRKNRKIVEESTENNNYMEQIHPKAKEGEKNSEIENNSEIEDINNEDNTPTLQKDKNHTQPTKNVDGDKLDKEAINNEIKAINLERNANTKAIKTSSHHTVQLRGISLETTNIYSSPSLDSEILKSYKVGSILKYQTYSSDWYICTVYINGKARTGYIAKSDIESIQSEQKNIKGYSLANPTKVYTQPTNNSNILKTYQLGKLLKYKSFTSGWYEATVYIKGEQYTGYIQANTVGSASISNTPVYSGIALKKNTSVYESTNLNSASLKKYDQGKILKYSFYDSNWFKATVYINGKAKIGFIHRNDVQSAFTSEEQQIKGIAKKNKTKVFMLASKSARSYKSYDAGSILTYRTFSEDWYKATVILKGKRYTGFIHKDDVDNSNSIQETKSQKIYGEHGIRVYSKASTSSIVLKTYAQGKTIKFKTFTKDWYEATVYISGKKVTGYIKKSTLEAGLQGKTIVIDPGHGGHDTGAVGNGIVEKNLNLSVSLALADKLKKAGATVILTRSNDTFIPLDERAKFAQKFNANIFVSIHTNSASPSAVGIETYYNKKLYNHENNPFPQESILLAQLIQDNLSASTSMKNRGIADAGFIVLRKNTVPSVLVELGFLTNKSEAAKMKKADYKYKAAEGIYNGIKSFFN